MPVYIPSNRLVTEVDYEGSKINHPLFWHARDTTPFEAYKIRHKAYVADRREYFRGRALRLAGIPTYPGGEHVSARVPRGKRTTKYARPTHLWQHGKFMKNDVPKGTSKRVYPGYAGGKTKSGRYYSYYVTFVKDKE